MLETVIELGKILRKDPKYRLKFHRYIKPYPHKDNEKAIILCIKVNNDFTFDFDKTKIIVDENLIKYNLFYYTFKTSDNDSNVKYIFGDIYYEYNGKGKEVGYYKLNEKDNKSQKRKRKVSSFERGIEDSELVIELYKKHLSNQKLTPAQSDSLLESFSLIKFRKEFENNLIKINNILKYSNGVIEHFKNYKEKIKFSDLIENEKQLKELTATNIYTDISDNKKRKTTLKKLFNNEDIQLKEILSSESNIDSLIENETSKVFIHFDFSDKSWFDLDEVMNSLNEKLLEDFAVYSEKVKGYYLNKYLYKTLVENNIFPEVTYKNKYFTNENEILDLLYAIDISKKAKLQIKFYNENLKPITTNIKIVVLPRCDKITAEQIDDFFSTAKDIKEEQGDEKSISVVQDNQDNEERNEKVELELEIDDISEPVLDDIINNKISNIIQFDLIFSKKGKSASTPDVDTIEISGVYKSKLVEVHESINKIKKELLEKWRKEHNENRKFFVNIESAFSQILNNNTKDQKRYQSHVCKTLPLIYRGNYYNDPIILPVFVEGVQKRIRNGNSNFNFIKYNFYFLACLQNYNKQKEIKMKIVDSHCYKMGILLGKMAYPLKFEIKSFEKNYVGNLTRRVAKLPDLRKLKTFIEEKLTIHNKYYLELKKVSSQLTEEIKNFSGVYDKNEVAFGFCESFFKYEPKQETNNLNITGEKNEYN